jgi:tetratricopeptide (TPR) repeat protein
MTSKSIWIAIIASVLSFVAGFLFANSLNRSELTAKQSVNEAPKSGQNSNAPATSELSLTSEEIQKKIASADENLGNFTFQKNLGMSLYRYAAIKQDAGLLPDALRIMERALAMEPADRDLQIGIGNAYFDKGYFNKDNDSLLKSREFYRRALAVKPTDADVRADLALTFFLHDPSDLTTAVAEFEKALASNPKHERALQFLTQTLIKQNEPAKAAATLEKLKQANPSNTAIGELTSLLAGVEQIPSK